MEGSADALMTVGAVGGSALFYDMTKAAATTA
jgi:hypothetical protein